MILSLKFRKKILICFFCVLMGVVLVVGTFCVKIKIASSPKTEITIVLDAGHGGIDGGCVGVNGSVESELNLNIVLKMKELFEEFGINVVLTRANEDALVSNNCDNFKVEDMEERKKIIENASPDFVISIHMNSFSDSSQKGAQVYYKKGDQNGEIFASSIQECMFNQLESARNFANADDFYLFNCVDEPSVIVECGFLSNADDEKLLNDNEYQSKIAYSILCGVLNYFNISHNLSLD